MESFKNIEEYLKDLKNRLALAMPKIREEIKMHIMKPIASTFCHPVS